MCSPYPEFVVTNIICIEKTFKGDRNSVRINRVRTNEVILYITCLNDILSFPYAHTLS